MLLLYNKNPISQLSKKNPFNNNFVLQSGEKLTDISRKIDNTTTLESYGILDGNMLMNILKDILLMLGPSQ